MDPLGPFEMDPRKACPKQPWPARAKCGYKQLLLRIDTQGWLLIHGGGAGTVIKMPWPLMKEAWRGHGLFSRPAKEAMANALKPFKSKDFAKCWIHFERFWRILQNCVADAKDLRTYKFLTFLLFWHPENLHIRRILSGFATWSNTMCVSSISVLLFAWFWESFPENGSKWLHKPNGL